MSAVRCHFRAWARMPVDNLLRWEVVTCSISERMPFPPAVGQNLKLLKSAPYLRVSDVRWSIELPGIAIVFLGNEEAPADLPLTTDLRPDGWTITED